MIDDPASPWIPGAEPGCPHTSWTVVTTARRLLNDRNPQQALKLLHAHLQRVDLTGWTVDRDLMEAARWYAELLLACRQDPDRQLAAAGFAHRSATTLDDLTARVVHGELLGRVAHGQSRYALALTVRGQVLDLVERAGPAYAEDTVPMRLALVDSLHHNGHCGQALKEGQKSWQIWLADPRSRGIGTGIGIGYARVLVGCGLHAEAAGLLADARRASPELATLLETEIDPRSPIAARLAREHAPVCARHHEPPTAGLPFAGPAPAPRGGR